MAVTASTVRDLLFVSPAPTQEVAAGLTATESPA